MSRRDSCKRKGFWTSHDVEDTMRLYRGAGSMRCWTQIENIRQRTKLFFSEKIEFVLLPCETAVSTSCAKTFYAHPSLPSCSHSTHFLTLFPSTWYFLFFRFFVHLFFLSFILSLICFYTRSFLFYLSLFLSFVCLVYFLFFVCLFVLSFSASYFSLFIRLYYPFETVTTLVNVHHHHHL